MKKIKAVALSLVACSSLSLQATECIDVVAGWNLKGASQTLSTQSYFGNSQNVSIVWSFDNASKSWSAYSPDSTTAQTLANSNFPVLSTIEMGKGYWVNSLVTSCLASTSSGNTQNSTPIIYGIETEPTTDTHIIYIAKGVAVNMDLQNYIQDLDDDTVTVTTSNLGTAVSGISISSDGKITGTATTIGQETTFNATLNDGTTTSMSNLKIVVVDVSSQAEPDMTYGTEINLSTFNLTTIGTFFEPDVNEEVMYLKLVMGTNLAVTDYILDGTAFVVENSETLTPLNKTATSFNLDFTTEQDESLTVLSAKPVLTINGKSAPAGLYEATVEFKTTSTLTNYTTLTDWWEETRYDETNTLITTISGLQAHLVDNEYSSVWINEDTQVRLLSGGSVQLLQKDGTFGSCNQCNNGANYYEKTIPTTTVYSGDTGGWGLTPAGYLKVGVANIGARLYKEASGQLWASELKAVGSTETLKWYYGINQTTFETLLKATVQP